MPGVSNINTRIAELKRQQVEQREERKRVQKTLRNEERKRRRLKDRANMLSNTDLLEVLGLRAEAKALPAPGRPNGGPAAPVPIAAPTEAAPADVQ